MLPEDSSESADNVGGRLRAAEACKIELVLVCLAPDVPLRSGDAQDEDSPHVEGLRLVRRLFPREES